MERMTHEDTHVGAARNRNTMVVIQCASTKQSDAGHLQTRDGKRVMFVAAPSLAPQGDGVVYAHPDDVSDTGKTWRKVLRDYNASPENDQFGLLPAWRLYCPRTYQRLKNRFGLDRLFILSAGWGLIRADFLTPNYDITFSNAAEKFKRRTPSMTFHDFHHLRPNDSAAPIVFFGGRNYLNLFCRLTKEAKNPRILNYAGKTKPDAPGCILRKFRKSYTNWHYTCAEEFGRDGRASHGAA